MLYEVITKNRRIAVSLADEMYRSMYKFIGSNLGNVYRVTGLQNVQLLNHLQHDVRHFAYTTGSIRFHPANIDVGKIVVGSAFASYNFV